ncbi:MAG: alpha/beta hydrolase [Psychrobium sp.]
MLKKLIIPAMAAILGTSANATPTTQLEEKKMQAIELNTEVGKLAANLYLPKGVKKPPVVIVTGAWTTVKEQMPANYAQALADKGYAAITFDFRGWGQSKDATPYLEDPTRKTRDISAVINAVSKLKQINGDKIAGLGICASSGYMLDAASGNGKISSVAVVAPWLHDKAMATAIYGGEESVKNLLAVADKAQHSSEPMVIEAASLTNKDALMYQAPYYTETDRGLIKEYDNKYNLASWDGWLNYDAQQGAKSQDKPILLVASEAMALPAGAHQYLDAAGDNVTSVWFDGVSQFDFYDQPKAISDAVDAVTAFFNKTL